jgi:DNA-directed RNA polymerase subunit RPC12/RpoP
MGGQPEARVCAQCGRRFAKPEVVESGRCPSCGGKLVHLEEARDPNQPGGDDEGR